MTFLASKGRSPCIDQERVASRHRVLSMCVKCLFQASVEIFQFPEAVLSRQQPATMEALVKAQNGAPRSSLHLDRAGRAMMRMNKSQLQEAIRTRGEEPPREWSNVELRDRLTELMELNGESTSSSKKTDLRQWIAELNKSSRKKELLKVFCEERLKLSLSGNETIPMLQKRATRKIYEISVASAMDPVGFGKWSTLTYGQLQREQPAYATWVQETLLEGGETCDYRLSRLGNWLMNQPDEDFLENTDKDPVKDITKTRTEMFPKAKSKTLTTTGGKGYGVKQGRGAIGRDQPGSSNDVAEDAGANADTMKLLMDTMMSMKEEIKQLRETQNPEEPRRKKKEDSEADMKAPTETSFTMVLDP